MPSSLDDLESILGKLEGGTIEVMVQIRGTRRMVTTASTRPSRGDLLLDSSCSAIHLSCLVSGVLEVFH